jgi:hypothetical protein
MTPAGAILAEAANAAAQLAALGTAATPTGSGLPHVVSGVQAAAASLIVNADVLTGADIAWDKINKSGATAADVGAVDTVLLGVASGVATLNSGATVVQNPANALTTPTASSIPLTTSGAVTIDDGWISTNIPRQPTGTGIPHVVSGVQDAAASLIVDADVASGANILWTKISKTGSSALDVGAIPTAWLGVTCGVATLDNLGNVNQNPAIATVTPAVSSIPMTTSGSTTLDTGWMSTMIGSGPTHATGLVPDPGATSGNTKFLREDGTWIVPPTASGTVAGGGTSGFHVIFDAATTIGNSAYVSENSGGTIVNLNATAATATPTNGIHLVGEDGAAVAQVIDAYAGMPSFVGRRAAGTQATPSAVLSGNTLVNLVGRGYNGSGFTTSRVAIQGLASNDWTAADNATEQWFYITKRGTATSVPRMAVHDDGSVSVGSNLVVGGTAGDGVFVAENAVLAQKSSGADSIQLVGLSGGTTSNILSLTPETLSGSFTATFPNRDITVNDWSSLANVPSGVASGFATLNSGATVVQNPASATTTPAVSSIPLTTSGASTIDDGWISANFARQATGTGLPHVISGVQEAAATLIVNADIITGADIDWAKINKSGATAADVGAIDTALEGVASGVATLNSGTTVVQNPASATATPTASSIPLTASGAVTLDDGWISANFARQPSGTGIPHVISGVQEAASSLIVDADVLTGADIAWAKISKSGATAADVGAIDTALEGVASGVATLNSGVTVVQNPASATATPTASSIPLTASGSTTIDSGWIGTDISRVATGTGIPHIVSGAQDAAASLIVNVDVHSGANIDWTKINKTGAVPGDVGALASAAATTTPTASSVPLTTSGATTIDDGWISTNFPRQATGTGIPHTVSGVQNAAASLIVDADVLTGADIAWAKISKSGATAADVGAVPTSGVVGVAGQVGVFSASGVIGSSAGLAVSSGMVLIDLGSGAMPASSSKGNLLQIIGADSGQVKIGSAAFGNTTAFLLQTVAAGGTRATPAATAASTSFFEAAFYGHDGNAITGARGYYNIYNANTWSGTNNDLYHVWAGTPDGSVTPANWMTLRNGNLLVGTSTVSGYTTAGNIDGIGIVQSKGDSTAGIALDNNAATGNFTLALSPAPVISAARRWSFADLNTFARRSDAGTWTDYKHCPERWEDYTGGFNSSGSNCGTSASGANASVRCIFDNVRPATWYIGGAELNMGTATTGRAASGFFTDTTNGPSNMYFGYGAYEYRVLTHIYALPDAVDTFIVRWGPMASVSGVPTDGVYFRLDYTENSGHFTCVCRNNGTETTADSGVAVAAQTDYALTIKVLADRSHAYFYVNGNQVADITTNITAANRLVTAGHAMAIKSAGTNYRNVYLRYQGYKYELTTALVHGP